MESTKTYWHVNRETILECDVLEEYPATNELRIDVTDAKTKGRAKKFSGERIVRAYQVYNYKPVNPGIRVGHTGEPLPLNPIPKDDVTLRYDETPSSSSGVGGGITTTPI